MEREHNFQDTADELKMKEILTDLGYLHMHPYAVKDIEHCFKADFFVPELKLIIECDGIYWHAHPDVVKDENKILGNGLTAKERRALDATRNKELAEAGYKVLRFWEGSVNKEYVRETLKEVLVLS